MISGKILTLGMAMQEGTEVRLVEWQGGLHEAGKWVWFGTRLFIETT